MKLFLLSSVPPKSELREKWINAIETKSQQTYDHTSIRYLICELHFDPERIEGAVSRKKFKSEVAPSIFPNSQK